MKIDFHKSVCFICSGNNSFLNLIGFLIERNYAALICFTLILFITLFFTKI